MGEGHELRLVLNTEFALFQIDPLQKEAQTVNEMYELIEQYKVPTPPEDFAVYQVKKPCFSMLDSNRKKFVCLLE